MELFEYLNSKKIEYADNKGYRQCLRELFNMNPANYAEKVNAIKMQEELDEETEDEISYDEASGVKLMDDIFSNTKDAELFNNVYKLAAAKMISEDPSIGQVVLFSYHYLPYYHLCLVDYLESPSNFNKENKNYNILVEKLS
jgi:hypothetical protein